MLFVEFRFFWFFLVVFSVYWSLRENRSRKIWLLICSYIFYAAWNWKFLFLLMGSSVLDYFVGTMLARTENPRARRGWLMLSLCANLGTLAFFKYFNFFVSSAAALLAWLGLPASVHTLNIILPVGISFYTFHSMSYTIDVYRGKMRAVSSLLDVAAFIGFFPQMVAGPIVRASTFLPQLRTLRIFSDVDVRGALVLFLTGFIKKACIADSVAPIVGRYFAAPEVLLPGSAWSPHHLLLPSRSTATFPDILTWLRFGTAARFMTHPVKFLIFRILQGACPISGIAGTSVSPPGCAITFAFPSAGSRGPRWFVYHCNILGYDASSVAYGTAQAWTDDNLGRSARFGAGRSARMATLDRALEAGPPMVLWLGWATICIGFASR